jgi:hypothetical protein
MIPLCGGLRMGGGGNGGTPKFGFHTPHSRCNSFDGRYLGELSFLVARNTRGKWVKQNEKEEKKKRRMDAVVCARVSRIKWLKAGLLVPFHMYCKPYWLRAPTAHRAWNCYLYILRHWMWLIAFDTRSHSLTCLHAAVQFLWHRQQPPPPQLIATASPEFL